MSSSKRESSDAGSGEESGSDDDEEDDEDQINFKQEDLIFNPESDQRKWLRTHGKSDFISFDDE